MRTIAIIAVACLGAAACSPTTTGTVAGATTGAIVGGPVGAVVGAGVGAVAGSTAGATAGAQVAGPGPGRCYVADRAGNISVDRRGNPVTTRC
jgi:phage tail tape-measure protein